MKRRFVAVLLSLCLIMAFIPVINEGTWLPLKKISSAPHC